MLVLRPNSTAGSATPRSQLDCQFRSSGKETESNLIWHLLPLFKNEMEIQPHAAL